MLPDLTHVQRVQSQVADLQMIKVAEEVFLRHVELAVAIKD